jgi:hypothetical protein
MVEHDSQVGELLAKLKQLGIEDNTIVMYSTDNGAEFMMWPDGGTAVGPGANVFNGIANPGNPHDPDHDILSALVKWVEEGDAPEKIIATKFVNNDPTQAVAFTRPICAYPELPRYQGKGNTNDAASFVCRKDDPDYNADQIAAPEYQR